MANALTGLFSLELAGNYVTQYAEAIIAFLAALFAIKVFKFVVLRKLKSLSKKTKNDFDDTLVEAIESIGLPFYLVSAVYTSSMFLTLPAMWETGLHYLVIITATFYGIRVVQKIAGYWLRKSIAQEAGTSVTSFFDTIIKIALWSVALLLILANMGYNVNSLLAGLGVAGIAIAFALQKVLEDIFSAFSIYQDKPFEVGDFIIIGNDMGTVQDIGLKSTRIKSLQGQELVVSNHEMTSTRINNYKKMKKRRIQFSFGVTYETPLKKLKTIPKTVEKTVKKAKNAELDRVHFKSYGDSALLFEVVYYMLVPDYNSYMDTQQEINLALFEEFKKQGIEFAYPTQTIYYSKMG